MKDATQRLAVFVAAGLLVGPMVAAPGLAEIQPEEIIGIWLLDEGKGDVAKDSSGNGNHGDLDGDPHWVDGQFDGAIQFEIGDRVVLGDIDAIDGFKSLTAMAWCKWDDQGGIAAAARIVSKQDVTKGDVGPFSLGSGWNGNRPTFWIHHGNWAGVHGATGLDDDDWHHVAGTFDGDEMRMYVDGIEEGVTKVGGVTGNSTPEGVAIASDGFGREYWRGTIDEVAIFNIGMDVGDIEDIMNDGLSRLALSVSASRKLATTWAGLKAR